MMGSLAVRCPLDSLPAFDLTSHVRHTDPEFFVDGEPVHALASDSIVDRPTDLESIMAQGRYNMSPGITSLPDQDFMPDYHQTLQEKTYVHNVTILVVLTFGGVLPVDLMKAGGAIEMAVEVVRQSILPEVYTNYYMVRRKGFVDCYEDENHASFLMTRYAFRDAVARGDPPVGLIVGPACTKSLESMGHIATDMRAPIMTSQGASLTFDDKTIFKTVTRTGVTVKTLSRFAFEFLDLHGYVNVAIIYDDLFSFFSVLGSMLYRALYYRQDVRMNPMDLPYRNISDYSPYLYRASNNSRGRRLWQRCFIPIQLFSQKITNYILLTVFDSFLHPGRCAKSPYDHVDCVRSWDDERRLCTATYTRMTSMQTIFLRNVHYRFQVFLTCVWYKEKYWGDYTYRNSDERDEEARQAYRTLLVFRERPMTPTQNETATGPQDFAQAQSRVKSIAWNRYGYGFDNNEDVSSAVWELYEGILLWARALNETISEGEDPKNGTRVTQRMWNRQVQGINGTLAIDANGDRNCSYALLDMSPSSGIFKEVFVYDGRGQPSRWIRTVDWGSGRERAPPNEPKCGYRNDKLLCFLRTEENNHVYTAVGAVGGAVVLLLLGALLVYRKYRTEQALHDTWWRASYSDIKPLDNTVSRSRRMASPFSEEPDLGLKKVTVARYQDRMVMVKTITHKIEMNRHFLVYVSKLHSINHDNLNRVVGICPDVNHEAILTDYCTKGSLADLLENDEMELDWGFKSSLITDLVSGLDYIHTSFLVSHGNLHSSNCLIDSRFTLKISDYAFPELRQTSKPIGKSIDGHVDVDLHHKVLLWRAPEFLRDSMPPAGSPKGDVYSMAIVLSEIVTRREPYASPLLEGIDFKDKSYEEIVQRIIEGPDEQGPLRPVILPEECPPKVTTVIQLCWAEWVKDRLSVRDAQQMLKEAGVAKGSVMDNIIRRMEQYAGNLESTINDRTKALLDEKKKVEELLSEILPSAVAEALKMGKQIAPEAFEMVTIYYSDIVGFTTISAKSTAFQVVDLLNDLYTMFDGAIAGFDAYKVETIGDAYVVASGVPVRNGDRHALEIANVALKFRDGVAGFTMRHLPDQQLRLRIGLHSGYVAAGVVGVKMPRYCLFGESVMIANKMESSGEAMKIQMSAVTKQLLDQFQQFDMVFRHIYDTGKGSIATYWLHGVRT
ncbi:hypothetical protein RvY_15145-1 [Ramazzottius varieornatus]|uniref:guanylate cyclase n=1 Tax=Ramazzottius varieornatus TaxID=947166 RepID=A0A1D1VTV3_RAMVA|nr:hypothetical protein RvY_15145-1 [Ramazzottius varieornatus]